MENFELKNVCIKNCTCYYFNDITKIEDFDFDNILIGAKSYQNILNYHVSYKTLIGTILWFIMFVKLDGFIKGYDGTKYLVLFGPEKYNAIYDRVRYFIGLKSGITYVFSHNYGKIKIDVDDDLPLGEMLTLHNIVILIKSVLNKNTKLLL